MKAMNAKTRLSTIITAISIFSMVPGYSMDSALLYSIDPQTYKLTLSGRVHVLGLSNSGTEVRMLAKIAEGKAFEAVTTTGPDGSFHLTVAFEGYPEQQVDWTLTARKGSVGVIDEGRQILSDELTIQLQKFLTLQRDPFVLAQR